ncbi:MAG: hypothetical protein GW949_06190 [Spirochaetales bacterium]|nr:hypothetical protein [Spirochaetales bacterium]
MTNAVGKLLAALVVFAVIAGCASPPPPPPPAPAPAEAAAPAPVVPEWQTVEHRNTALGGNVPNWATMSTTELEEFEYPNDYVFRMEQNGANLEGTRVLLQNMNIPVEVARIVETRVEQTFAGAQVGDQDFLETYFENVVKVVAETNFSGLRRRDDFWIRQQNRESGAERYVYYALYTIPRENLDAQIQAAITGVPAVTEEEETARDRVREIFESGL